MLEERMVYKLKQRNCGDVRFTSTAVVNMAHQADLSEEFEKTSDV